MSRERQSAGAAHGYTGPMGGPGRLLTACAAGCALLAACGGSAKHATTARASFFLRTCDMVGSGGLATDYRRRGLVLGPLVLGNLREYTARQPLPGELHGRFGAYEVIAIVAAGTEPTLSLPRSEWPTVGLLYDPSKFRDDGAYRISRLDQSVRFRACTSPRFNHGVSQFDGGFVVSRKQCVRFVVTVPGGRSYHGQFPAAAPCTTRD